MATNHRSDLPKGYTFFRYRVVSDSSSALFESKPINNGGIESVYGWPALEPVGHHCPTAQAIEVFKRTAVHFGAYGGKGRGSSIRASQADNRMTCADEFASDGGADETCRPSNKDAHILILSISFILCAESLTRIQ